jgi:hypothetical protein
LICKVRHRGGLTRPPPTPIDRTGIYRCGRSCRSSGSGMRNRGCWFGGRMICRPDTARACCCRYPPQPRPPRPAGGSAIGLSVTCAHGRPLPVMTSQLADGCFVQKQTWGTAETDRQPIQNSPLVKRLTLQLTGACYVALPSSSGPPEHPRASGLGTRPQRGGAVVFPLSEMAELSPHRS